MMSWEASWQWLLLLTARGSLTRLLCWKASSRPLRIARGSTTTMVASTTLDRSRSHATLMVAMEYIAMDITTMVGMDMCIVEDTTIMVGMATTTTMVTGMAMAMGKEMAMEGTT